eukprot:TRINITY_DN218_c0_g1_i1.p1 TRINITY_DN218_c0_g1~~TRINITY_DN218_c0_g1_i1.p1  ORF type:complete len:208 (-),score=33.93 TRINITY_DN218_c0_g1_i1:135-728(-)
MSDHFDLLYKVLLIGDSGVGKSCLLLRFVDDTFTDGYISTIGVDFKIKTIKHDGKVIKLQIWDTAGQERFRTITSSYYRGAHGIIVVFDLTEPQTFDHVQLWIKEIDRYSSNTVTKLLIGNKCDQAKAVEPESINRYVEEIKIPYVEASAKQAINVSQAFETMTKEIYEKLKVLTPAASGSSLQLKSEPVEPSGCPC